MPLLTRQRTAMSAFLNCDSFVRRTIMKKKFMNFHTRQRKKGRKKTKICMGVERNKSNYYLEMNILTAKASSNHIYLRVERVAREKLDFLEIFSRSLYLPSGLGRYVVAIFHCAFPSFLPVPACATSRQRCRGSF